MYLKLWSFLNIRQFLNNSFFLEVKLSAMKLGLSVDGEKPRSLDISFKNLRPFKNYRPYVIDP